jgi:deazaflavin-dependent oxidoreductase (nitroreductase family)
MTETPPMVFPDGAGQAPLALMVGCAFGLECGRATSAIMQVAPRPEPSVSIRHEAWDTDAHHHCYVDHYGNRCERFELEPGRTRIAYEASVLLPSPADLIKPAAPETPVALLPDEVLSFIMPSRFCLPDELGNEAWQRFGGLAPGWGRVQAIVDYVHGYLEWVPGASASVVSALMSIYESVFRTTLQVHAFIYEHTDGLIGHRMLGVPCLMLRTTGRKTGQTRTNSLVYAKDGDRYVVVASKGGDPKAPAWLLNLRAKPEVEVQIGRTRFPATATEIGRGDPDYARLWKLVNDKNGNRYDASYQKKTTRPIPLVAPDPFRHGLG